MFDSLLDTMRVLMDPRCGRSYGHHDWVLTAGTAGDWARRLWDFDRAAIGFVGDCGLRGAQFFHGGAGS